MSAAEVAPDDRLITRMSMGQHGPTRTFGKIFVAANALFILVALFRAVRYGGQEDETGGAVIFSAFLAFCAYEIWAFTHGRATSIDSHRHEATPDRTGWRVFGLALDVLFWFICMRFLKSW